MNHDNAISHHHNNTSWYAPISLQIKDHTHGTLPLTIYPKTDYSWWKILQPSGRLASSCNSRHNNPIVPYGYLPRELSSELIPVLQNYMCRNSFEDSIGGWKASCHTAPGNLLHARQSLPQVLCHCINDGLQAPVACEDNICMALCCLGLEKFLNVVCTSSLLS